MNKSSFLSWMTVRRASVLAITLACLARALAVPSNAADVRKADYSGNVAITFAGKSSLHDFKGTVKAEGFEVRATPASDGKSTHYAAEVDVKVAEMDTANNKRDQTMRGMFDAPDFPLIHGSITNLVVTAAGPQPTEIQLTIRDKVNTLPVTVSQWKTIDDTLTFHMHFDVSLKNYGLKAPSVMRVIRVADNVSVDCDVTAAKPAASASK